jgi:hypothetical protein
MMRDELKFTFNPWQSKFVTANEKRINQGALQTMLTIDDEAVPLFSALARQNLSCYYDVSRHPSRAGNMPCMRRD